MSFVQLPPMKLSHVTAGPHPHRGADAGTTQQTSGVTRVTWTRVRMCAALATLSHLQICVVPTAMETWNRPFTTRLLHATPMLPCDTH